LSNALPTKQINKKKIFNDPVYGFITISHEIIFDLVEHRYFQRLRHIMQLGLSHLVYPGALHTRFHHALGAMHLMSQALEIIKQKGHEVTEEEEEAAVIAILLHDIGHGPFSHALETCLIDGVSHEDISILMMENLNKEFGGRLTMAISIFKNTYSKNFLHQLVSGQLDMDRMDYLNRDSFYTGVSEGVIGFDRILKMISVVDDELVIEEKGIYSIEKFLVARRLMYWQVYLHKTVLSAEQMLVKVLRRAKTLALSGNDLFGSPALKYFLNKTINEDDFRNNPECLDHFSDLDDHDLFSAFKVWAKYDDKLLSFLCKCIVNRNLFKIELANKPFPKRRVAEIEKLAIEKLGITKEDVHYAVFTNSVSNNAYNIETERINIVMKNGEILDISEASDNLNIRMLSTPVEKYYLCYPKVLNK
jgi:HD superfamily phosphohydrolase